MITWDDLRYVLAVRRYGSLARAAEALGLNKSTVSRRISALEEELGVALFQRGRRGYELTAAGNLSAAAAEEIERRVGELVKEVGDTDRVTTGIVRVTVPAWFAQHLIIPALPALRETHPGLDVHLITSDEVLNLARREADIGIRNTRTTQQSLYVRKGGDVAFAMYAARSYLEAHGEPKDRASLEGHHLIAFRNRVAHVSAYRWTNALPCPIAVRATDAVSMLDAVAAGMGIGVLPCLLADPAKDVVRLDSVGPPEPEAIWLASHPDARETERVRVVLEWLIQIFADNAELLAGRG